ncbi:MAG: hypothetical protein RLZZ450_5689 [Pseudomonadota bacterium]|jgi:hypothetical protein
MRSARSLRNKRRLRGTASVEVVMMLPFFLIVYAGIYWMYGHYMGRQQAMLRARSCTWEYAAAGCQDSERYKTCLTAPTGGGAPDVEQSDQPVVASGAGKSGLEGEVAKNEVGTSKVGKIMNKFESVPILGDALHYLFGTPVLGRSRQPVRFGQNRFGPSEKAVPGAYSTLCNSVPKDWDKVAKDIFCGFMNNKFPNCP